MTENLCEILARDGIAKTPAPFSLDFIRGLNAAIDPLFSEKTHEQRSYVRSNDLARLGWFIPLMQGRMKDIITALLPDPVLYHCHAYETAGGSSEPHIFADRFAGWHADPDSEHHERPTHISLFLHLSDIEEDDGAFEFRPMPPSEELEDGQNAIRLTGEPGYCFVWSRSHFHRASPNRGPKRRRLLKLSIQPNSAPNINTEEPDFAETRERVPEGDTYIDMLLGRYIGRKSPPLSSIDILGEPISPNIKIKTTGHDTLTAKARSFAKSLFHH